MNDRRPRAARLMSNGRAAGYVAHGNDDGDDVLIGTEGLMVGGDLHARPAGTGVGRRVRILGLAALTCTLSCFGLSAALLIEPIQRLLPGVYMQTAASILLAAPLVIQIEILGLRLLFRRSIDVAREPLVGGAGGIFTIFLAGQSFSLFRHMLGVRAFAVISQLVANRSVALLPAALFLVSLVPRSRDATMHRTGTEGGS